MIWEPIATKILGQYEGDPYIRFLEQWSTPLKVLNASTYMIFTTMSNRLYIVRNMQFNAVRIDHKILGTHVYPERKLIDFAFSKNTVAFLAKNPYGVIVNDMGLYSQDQIDRQIFMDNIMWTELVMFKNIKMKQILSYWSNLIVLLENGKLLTLFANRPDHTLPWKMSTMVLKLPDRLGAHNVITKIEDTDYVFNLITNRCITKEEDVDEYYPPIFKLQITDGEIFANIKPNDRNLTIPNTVLHVMDAINT